MNIYPDCDQIHQADFRNNALESTKGIKVFIKVYFVLVHGLVCCITVFLISNVKGISLKSCFSINCRHYKIAHNERSFMFAWSLASNTGMRAI